MKAKIKATGEIVDENAMVSFNGDDFYLKELEIIQDDPDYWTRLEHQYAGMAMQGILAHEGTEFRNYLSQEAMDIAHALVQKLKEKEERK